jgi:hypothetical protein
MNLALQAWVTWQVAKTRVRDRLVDQHGEGVISTAIAVLIMALIGLLMWTVFQNVFNDAGERIEKNVSDIG